MIKSLYYSYLELPGLPCRKEIEMKSFSLETAFYLEKFCDSTLQVYK
jgi:hypothetical protein